MKVLVAGWFSFEGMGATAGDLLCRDLVCDWLRSAGIRHEVAVAAPFEDGIDWQTTDADAYSHVVFVCGPFGNGPPVTDFLERFGHCSLIGMNLTMLDRLANWNPFDLLLERDSDEDVRPDLAFLAPPRRVPIVGLILAHAQKEYGKRGRHNDAEVAIRRLLDAREASVVPIDTRLDENATGLRTPHEVESLIARMDAVVTTRLHGTVLALKNGVPALAIDPIAGGAKVSRQTAALGWPVSFQADALDEAELDRAFTFCLGPDARAAAKDCAGRARVALAELRPQFLEHVSSAAGRVEV